MNPLTRPLTGLVAACLAAVLLAGCSDDAPEPQFADPTSGSASPSTSEPSTATSPSEVEGKPLTRPATVRAWIQARNVLLATGDDAEVSALSSDDCESCWGLIHPIRDLYADGGSISSPGWKVTAATSDPDAASDNSIIAAVIMRGGETVQREGAAPKPFPRDKVILRFSVSRAAGSWVVGKVVFLS